VRRGSISDKREVPNSTVRRECVCGADDGEKERNGREGRTGRGAKGQHSYEAQCVHQLTSTTREVPVKTADCSTCRLRSTSIT